MESAAQIKPGCRTVVTTVAPAATTSWVLKLRSRLAASNIPAIANDVRKTRDLFFMRTPFLAALLAFILSAPTFALASPAGPSFDRVFIIVLENTEDEDAAKQPFLSSLAARGALLTNLAAEAHPSQPNYLALVAGSTFGVTSDATVDIDESHVGDLIEKKGLKWKAYAEGYPGDCFLGERSGLYVRKHLPFLSFKNIQSDPRRCAQVVDASQLAIDIQQGKLPALSLYIPDLKNDGHDTGVAYADQWLARSIGPLLNQPNFMKGMLVIVTFDEDKSMPFFPSSNRVFTVLFGDAVVPGSTSGTTYTHYSILRTIEETLGLGSLNHQDAAAVQITGIWR